MKPQQPVSDPAVLAELARLLPAPGSPAIAADRRQELKDVLMQEITHPSDTRPVAARRRRLWIMALAVPATAAALVAAAVIGPWHPWSTTGAASSAEVAVAPVVVVQQGVADQVGPLLERAAAAAGDDPATKVDAEQFVYIKSRVAWLVFADDEHTGPKEAGVDRRVLDKVHDREAWLPQSTGDKGLIRERGETFALNGARHNDDYATLPTEPDALLRKIYDLTRGSGSGAESAAFDYIGEALRESLLPPQVTAALYRAAAKIPGTVVVADSVDAAGRHGIAVARTDELDTRTEWIFDPNTFEFLGERSYLAKDTIDGKAGTLTGTTAILARAVVDRKGQRPS